MTLSRRPWQRPLAGFLAALLLLSPTAAAQEVAESGAAIEAFAIGDAVPSLPAAAVGLGAANATKGRSAPVSARGTFSTSIPIQVPPGRLGMTPSLSLVYDSGAFRQDSSFGAGWALPMPRIARSTVYGFPKLRRTADALSYDDAEARFEAGGAELGKLPEGSAAPPKAFADGAFYVPLRESEPVVYEYSAEQGAWTEHRPDGVKRYYGLEGGRKARIQTELGAFAWLLLSEKDPDGNRIRYEYRFIEQQDRADKYRVQQEPILRLVTWGGRGHDEPDPFRVILKATPTPHGARDLMRGNTQATGTVSSIVVCGPNQSFTRASGPPYSLSAPSPDCTGSLYWSYALEVKTSADTGRKILSRVTRTNPWGDPERTWTLRYQGNGGQVHFGPPERLVKDGDRKDLLLFTRYGNRLTVPVNTRDKAINPPQTSIGARFVDLNHDGRTDVVYHPSGIAAPEAGILLKGKIDPPPNRLGLDFDEFVRSRVRTDEGVWESFDLTSLGFKEFRYQPDGRFPYSDLADVNGDGRVDGVFFNGSVGEGFPGGRRREPCFSEAFWRSCGVIDPPGIEICRITNVCEQTAELDMTMCANGSCWITPTDLRNLFSDWADWRRISPFSPQGTNILVRLGSTVDVAQSLISVPALLLRARLKIASTVRVPQGARAFSTAMSTPETCAGMMSLCTGGSLDGVPSVRIGVDLDSTLVKLGRKKPSLSGMRPSASGMRVLPPEYRMNFHAGGGSPDQVAATIPLLGWPAGVYKMTSVEERAQLGPDEWRARPGADFSAPLVDVNGDGLADLVLLKSTEVTAASQLLPSTEFTPRAFIARHSPVAGGFPDVAMELDWKSFLDQYPDAAGEEPAVSDFTQSLQDVLLKPGGPYCNTVDCVPQEELTYPVGPSYNSFVLDLNGDNLPDLVTARPDPPGTCPAMGSRKHDVFLNRGYRFGVPAQGATPARPIAAAPFASGPFELLLKRDLGEVPPMPGCPALVLGDSVPMAAASFTDINGDGRLDVVFQWHVLGGGPSLSRRVFLNRGTHFDALSAAAASSYGLPDVPLAAVRENSPRGLHVGDLARLEDVDNDGLVDFVAAGTFCFQGDSTCFPLAHPDMPDPLAPSSWESVGILQVVPAFVYRNTGKVPDLLTKVEESSGAYTEVTYAPARTGPVTSPWVPPGMMVVSEVKRAAGPSSPAQTVRLTYDNYVKTPGTPEAVGFERVTAVFEDRDGATVTGTLKQTRVFDVRPRVEGVALVHPGKGLERQATSEGDGRRMSTSTIYAFLPYGEGVRIRVDQADNLTCLLGADGSCAPNELAVSRTAIAARDGFGFATDVVAGDVVGGVLSATDRVRFLTTYDHRTDLWALGNRNSESVRGRSANLTGVVTADAQLSSWTAVYDEKARLTRVERPGITPASCAAEVSAAAATTEVLAYDIRGLPLQVRTNGERTATFVYDDNKLHPRDVSVGVQRFIDGAVQSGETTLATRTERDLRTGQVWSARDPNGSVIEVRRDSYGRVTRSYDANGVLVERNAYRDVAPARIQKWLMTSSAGQARYVDLKLDGFGQGLAQFESKWVAGEPSETVRLQATDFDSAGNPVRDYLPKATSAMPGSGDVRTTRVFDSFGLLKRQQSPDGTPGGRVTVMEYGPRRSASTDPRGTATNRRTDWQGALWRIERTGGSESAVVQFERDGLGRVVALVDADGAVRRFQYDGGGRLHRYTLPHSPSAPASGTFEQCFDAAGMLAQSTDPVGGRVRARYDRLSRPVVKEVDREGTPTPSRYTYGYDSPEPSRKALGRLWRATGPAGATEVAYDARGYAVEGRYLPSPVELGGGGWPGAVRTSLRYGLQGQLTKLSYRLGSGQGVPAGTFTYSRDARGRLTSVTDGSSTLATDVHYDVFQRMDRVAIGSGIAAAWEWTPESQDLNQIEYKRGDAMLVDIERRDFDKMGNPGREKRTGQGPVVERVSTFDGFERLKTSTISIDGSPLVNETYQYSPGGRLLTAGGDAYLYDKPSLWGATTAIGSRILDYDLRGNVVSDEGGDRKLRYDAQGCALTIESTGGERVQALCDDNGNHVYRSTRANGGSSRVVTMGLSEVRPDDGVLLHRLPLNGSVALELAYRLSDGALATAQSRVVMLDSRGSIVATSSIDGATTSVLEAVDYEAWGNRVRLGESATPRHEFAGFEADQAFGTYAFGRRIYDPSLRRWLSPDPLVLSSPDIDSDGRQLDLYGYAANNPVQWTDTNGQIIPAIVLGAVLVGVALGLGNDHDKANLAMPLAPAAVYGVGVVAMTASMTASPALIEAGYAIAGGLAEGAAVPLTATAAAGGGRLVAEYGDDAARGASRIVSAMATRREGGGAPRAAGQAADAAAEVIYKVRSAGKTGAEAATDAPSWVKEAGHRPVKGQKGEDFAKRLLDDKYGEGKWEKGAGSEFSKIKKYADRAFEDPPKKK